MKRIKIVKVLLKSIIALILLCSAMDTFCQSKVILDSLNILYKKASKDTTKILLLSKIANITASKEGLYYAIKGYHWARNIKYKKGELRNRYSILDIRYTYFNDTSRVEQNFNELIKQCQKINDIETNLECNLDLSNYYREIKNDTYTCLTILNNALKIAIEKKQIYAILLYVNLFWTTKEGNIDKAAEYLQNAIKFSSEFNNLESKLYLLYVLDQYSQYYTIKKEYPKAIEQFLKCNKIIEFLKDELALQYNYENLGTTFFLVGNYKNSLKYYLLAYNLIKDTISDSYYDLCSTLGWSYYCDGNYKKALTLTEKALNYSDKNELVFFIQCNEGLGLIYLKLKNYDKALKFALKSQKLLDKIKKVADKKNYVFPICLIIASVNQRFGRYTEANIYAKKALYYAEQNKSNVILQDIYRLLYENYEKQNEFKKALFFYEKAIYLHDSVTNINNSIYLTDRISEEETKNKNTQILLANKDKKIALEKNRVQRLYSVSFAVGLVLVLILTFVSFRNYKQQKKFNTLLNLQKKEIEERNEELNRLNEEISSQRDILIQQKKDITDSIEYARFIQQALLSSQEVLNNCKLSNFIFYKPRDIISGDFYWFKQVKNFLYFTAADCTGHGVPGAFMSVLGISLLNEIVGKRDLNPPSMVLNELRKRIKKSLKQDDPGTKSHDGMDITLCLLDMETNQLQFAGAYNPLILIRNNELTEYETDRMPVGIHPKDNNNFTNYEIQLLKSDSLYLFSDGYASQFGGPDGKKFNMKQFKNLLLNFQTDPLENQKQVLENNIMVWQGNIVQVDDILVIGIKI